jgi:hypothetical protein
MVAVARDVADALVQVSRSKLVRDPGDRAAINQAVGVLRNLTRPPTVGAVVTLPCNCTADDEAPLRALGGHDMTRILALDLSITATGLCTPDGDHDVYHPCLDKEWRIRDVRNMVARTVRPNAVTPVVDLVVIEDYLVRTPAAAMLGMLHGAVRVALMDAAIPYFVVAPATLKVYATGNGRADKADMRVELLKRTGLDVRDDNAVDARWLWYLAHDLLGQPVMGLPQTHRRALDKLTLPQGALT